MRKKERENEGERVGEIDVSNFKRKEVSQFVLEIRWERKRERAIYIYIYIYI